jgi:hypothetical protein
VGLRREDMLDGLRHFVACHFAVDTLDGSFGAGGLRRRMQQIRGKSYAAEPRRKSVTEAPKQQRERTHPHSLDAAVPESFPPAHLTRD